MFHFLGLSFIPSNAQSHHFVFRRRRLNLSTGSGHDTSVQIETRSHVKDGQHRLHIGSWRFFNFQSCSLPDACMVPPLSQSLASDYHPFLFLVSNTRSTGSLLKIVVLKRSITTGWTAPSPAGVPQLFYHASSTELLFHITIC